MTAKSRYLSALGNWNETARRADETRRELAALVAVPVSDLELGEGETIVAPVKLAPSSLDESN